MCSNVCFKFKIKCLPFDTTKYYLKAQDLLFEQCFQMAKTLKCYDDVLEGNIKTCTLIIFQMIILIILCKYLQVICTY